MPQFTHATSLLDFYNKPHSKALRYYRNIFILESVVWKLFSQKTLKALLFVLGKYDILRIASSIPHMTIDPAPDRSQFKFRFAFKK